MRQKRCRNPECLKPFHPEKPMQVVCSPGCAHPYVRHREAQKFKAETRKRRREMNQNDRKWWIKQAKTICHKFIRMRDAHLACISCGTKRTAQWDAGHYRPAGNNSALRFHELNIHKQCCQCNDGHKKSGNLTEYRIGLIKKIGQPAVDWLEGPQPLKKWTIEELREVVEYYKRKIKDLKNASGIV